MALNKEERQAIINRGMQQREALQNLLSSLQAEGSSDFPVEKLMNLPGDWGPQLPIPYDLLSMLGGISPETMIDFSGVLGESDYLSDLANAISDDYQKGTLMNYIENPVVGGLPERVPASFFRYDRPWRGGNFLETLANLQATQNYLTGAGPGATMLGELGGLGPQAIENALGQYQKAYGATQRGDTMIPNLPSVLAGYTRPERSPAEQKIIERLIAQMGAQ